ncbi:probable 2-oxoglutarate-dependent dioxygenase SLC1 [Musa acuminata AAA Group]|uniref:probable 2-oxoglutarate-dependent dioxygenase SLC1 n=1 Tax=Musa acuminata AAA Group TaxID=214697 RepID=UPI0031E0B69C
MVGGNGYRRRRRDLGPTLSEPVLDGARGCCLRSSVVDLHSFLVLSLIYQTSPPLSTPSIQRKHKWTWRFKARGEARCETNYMKRVRHLCDNGITKVPSKYVLPLPDRPQLAPAARKPSLKLPVIDVGQLLSPDRTEVLATLDRACKEYGFFQTVNHSIAGEVTRRMIDVGKRFFELRFEERAKYMKTDVRGPVTYGTSFNQTKDRVFCWRDFLQLSCHPLDSVLPWWPTSPMDLRDEVVSYAKHIKSLFLVLMAAVPESLGADPAILKEFDDGSQLMAINCYRACTETDLTLGMPPHSDYGFLTFVLQDELEGLQVLHRGEWITVEPLPNSVIVNVGDHLEIYSNRRYKIVLHRALVNTSKSRLSMASLHSVSFDRVVRLSPELVDKDHPKLYKDTDFAAFLTDTSCCETKHKHFLESRKDWRRTNPRARVDLPLRDYKDS